MPPPLQKFRSHEIAEDPFGNSLELWRTEHEVVCLASSPALRRFVELHVLTGIDTSQTAAGPVVAAFRAQVQALQKVNDPHVIEVREAGDDEGALFYVTEFIDGESLDSYLARCNPLPTWLAVELARQLAAGLMALRGNAALLSQVSVFNARLTLEGETTDDAVVKLADFGLGGAVAEPPSLPDAEQRSIRQVGRLLSYALSGVLADHLDVRALATLPVPVRLAELLARVLDPASRQPVPNLPALLESLAACRHDLTPATPPERLPQSLRPRLPLQGHFATLAELTSALSPRFRLERTAFDSAHPYSQRAFDGTRPVTVHLLPPSRLMADDYLAQIRLSADRTPSAGDPGPVLRVLEFAPGPEPGWFVEEGPPRLSLDAARRLRRNFSPGEAAVFLREINRAVVAVEKLGLPPVTLCPQQVFIAFAAPAAGSEGPGDEALAVDPVDRWPAFAIRLRAHPVPLQLLQPHRFRRERLIRGGPHARHDAAPVGLRSPNAADYAAIFLWLCGGIAHVPGVLAPLVAQTLAGGGEPERNRFLDRILSLIPKPPKNAKPTPKTGGKAGPATAPAKDGRKNGTRRGAKPPALRPRGTHDRATPVSARLTPPTAAPAKPRSNSPHIPTPDDSPGTGFLSLAEDGGAEEIGEEAGGFAEVLLGVGGREQPRGPDPTPSHPRHSDFPFPMPPTEPPDEDDTSMAPVGALFGGWRGDPGADDGASPLPPLSHLPESPPTHLGLLLVLIVVAALAIAAVMAHVTGLAPWK